MIKRVTSQKKKPNYQYDSTDKLWFAYRLDLRVNGKRKRLYYSTLKDANNAHAELLLKNQNKKHGIKSIKPAKEPTLKELFDKRVAETHERKAKNLRKRVYKYFLEILSSDAKITEVKTSDLRLFIKKREKETTNRNTIVKPETVDRELTEIVAALNDAPNVFDGLEDYITPKVPRPQLSGFRRERVISEAEITTLIDYYNEPRRPNESEQHYFERVEIGHSIEFALLTSSRRKEVVKLKKTDYFPAQDVLKITRWKTLKSKAEPVTIFSPVPARVKELLETRLKVMKGDYFFSRNGEDSQGYLKSLKAACAKLGIPYGRFTEGGLIFHDTRHTFVSGLISNGIDLETTRELAGLSRDMILRYAHSSPEQKRKAVDVINRKSAAQDLQIIFEKVRRNEIDFNEFERLLILYFGQKADKVLTANQTS